MEFLLLIATDAEPGLPEESDGELDRWLEEGSERGIRLRGDRLGAPDSATTVRVRSGEVLVSDGPFTESKEWIVGYDVIDCADLTAALEYASRHPMARRGRIEVRQVRPLFGQDS